MPLNPQIPFMAGQNVPAVSSPTVLMKDVMDLRQQQAQLDNYQFQAEDRKAQSQDRHTAAQAAQMNAQTNAMKAQIEADNKDRDDARVLADKIGPGVVSAMRVAATDEATYNQYHGMLEVAADVFTRAGYLPKGTRVPPWSTDIQTSFPQIADALAKAFAPKTGGGPMKMKKQLPDGSEVEFIISPDTGLPIGPEYPQARGGSTTAGTWAEYRQKYLPVGATQDDEDALRIRYEKLNDPSQPTQGENFVLTTAPKEEERNAIFPGTAMTYQGVWNDAEDYLLTGTIKQNPRAADPKERAGFNAIKNAANARLQPGGSIPAVRAEYAMLNGAQKQMFKKYLETSAFVDSATQGINKLRSVSDSYPRTDVPVVNDIKLWWNRNLKADSNLSELEVWVFNAARDYAKATSGSSGSVAQMTDAQIKASEMLLSLRQGPDAFLRASTTMMEDMGNQVNAQRSKLNETRTGILNILDDNFGKPWLPAGAQAETKAKASGSTSAKPAAAQTTWDGKSQASEGMIFTAPNGRKLVYALVNGQLMWIERK